MSINIYTTNLVFVDARVDNYQSLIEETAPNTEVIVLDSSQDGIEQITQTLAGRTDIESVQIISHGNDGQLNLGARILTSENINTYSQQLSQWGNALTENGDILLLGCNIAASDTGKTFVQQLSQITGADVASSEDLTGNVNLGGDWVLEYATGLIDAPLALQIEAMEAYDNVLAEFTVDTATELQDAIEEANNTFESDEIFIEGDIDFFNTINLPIIGEINVPIESLNIDPTNGTDDRISIYGNGHTINGGNRSQIFSIFSGTVLISDLTLQNGRATGGDGTDGGGGGLGAGGALYLDGGNVTVENVTFNNNQAIGGSSPNGAGQGGSDENGGLAGGNGGGLNGRQDETVGTGGAGGGTENNGSPGGEGQFGAGGGGAGGGGGGTTAPDVAGNGGNGGNGGFGGGGGGGGGGGEDIDIIGGDENGSGGAGGTGGEFAGDGGAGVGGGGSRNGGRGGGGAGLGGAIFVNSGASLNLIDATFNNNSAEGGTGANNGEGRGGAIFVRNGATVSDVGTIYNGNSASTGDNNIFGTIGNLTLPTLQVFDLTTPVEPGTDGAFRLTLNQAFDNDIEVNYNIAGTATEGTDYTIAESVTIPAGETQVEVPVTILDDTRFDPDETIVLTLEPGNPNFYTIGFSDSATLTIDDNEPEVSITAGTNPTEENEVTGAFNIALSEPAPDGGLAVEYTLEGTASLDDYTATLNGEEITVGSLIIPEGDTTAEINIEPVDDALIEGEETLEISLLEPLDLENYAVQDDAETATLSIIDNEKLPVVKLGTIGNPSEDGPTSGSFSIFLADPETGEPLENPPIQSDGEALELEVLFEVSGTANNGEDYSSILTSSITIPATKTSQAIPVETLNDLIDEGNETVRITLSDDKPDGAIYNIDTTPATLTITDNDTVGITISEINGDTNERGGEASFTVKLDSEPEEPVTLNFTSSDTTEGELLTPSITFDASNWNQFQTVNVAGVDDSERDGDRNLTIQTNISTEDVQYSELDVEEIEVKNIDNETENVLITQSNGSTEIGEDGTTDSFEVVLTGFPIDDVVVNITPDSQVDLGNGIGQPIALNFTPENASTPQIVTVEAVDDDVVEGEHLSNISYIVNSNDPLYAGLGGEINVDIADNDNPTVSLKAVGNGSEQSIIPGVFQLALDHPASSQGLTVNYTVSNSTILDLEVATAGTDYTIVGLDTVEKSGSVYIAPGETGVNINVTPIQDLITELGGETVTIELETGTGYNIGTVDPQSVIITDDDVPGVRVLETGNGTEVVEQNAATVDTNKTDRYQISLTSSPGVGETVTITPNFNNTNLQLLDSSQNPISEITFDETNWNQSQTITVVGLDDSQAGTPEQIITHSSSSTDANSPYNNGLEIDGKPLPEVTVEISEPTYDSGEIADGLELILERIAESLREMFQDTNLPIIGSLSGSEPTFIETLKNNIVNAIKSTANLTQDKLENLLKEKLETIFPDVEVISSSLPEEIAFDIDLGNRYETTANLSKDFGLPALGLEIDGKAEANFNYDLDLKFGYHQEFGFFVDTEETQITADAFVGFDDNFNATATLGFLELNVENGAEDAENGGTKNTQAELNAKFALEDIDLDSDGNLIEDSGDGNRLTLTELKGFNTLRNNNQASLENLFELDIEADAQVGLNAKTSISGNAAIPSFDFELVGQNLMR